jgi:hypothetical protein
LNNSVSRNENGVATFAHGSLQVDSES